MQCRSCKEEVDFKMRKALASNECPYCGGQILEKEVMQQLIDLRAILEPQRLTDNEWVDKKIKERIIGILMEHTKCVKIKDIKQDEGVVKLNESEQLKSKSEPANLVAEQKSMRKEMYIKAHEEQYGAPPADVSIDTNEENEDAEAARGVVFSEAADPKVERLKAVAKTGSTVNKPIRRLQ